MSDQHDDRDDMGTPGADGAARRDIPRPAEDAAYALTDATITVPRSVWNALLENIAILTREHDTLLSVVRQLLEAVPAAPADALPEDARYSLKELRKFL